MRNLLLSVALIALPTGLFALGYQAIGAHQTAAVPQDSGAPGLGDLSGFAAIVVDVAGLVNRQGVAAAEHRITDFETAWDQAAASLRPINPTEWGNVDAAADAAMAAMRSGAPDKAQVAQRLADLSTTLANPGGKTASPAQGMLVKTNGIATTDANGRPLPCEVMLTDLTARLAHATLSTPDLDPVKALQTKATERCNADDDARADAFSAEAIALIPGS